jgi:hypothetical protein
MPQDFNIEGHWRHVQRVVSEFGSAEGIRTNEHRQLLIVRKG